MPKPAPAKDVAEVLPAVHVNKSTSRAKKARQHHQVITEWTEVGPVNAPAPKARKSAPVVQIVDSEDDDDTLDEVEELPDTIAAVLEEYASDGGLLMDVNRLPDYTLNRRTDPAAWHWVTMMPFTPNFKQEIALRHARPGESNWFLIVLKDSNGRILKREQGSTRIGPFAVEAASDDEKRTHGIPVASATAPVVTSTVNQSIPQPVLVPPSQSVTERINEVAQIFAAFKEMGLIPKQPNPAPAPAVLPAPVQSEEDILIRAMLASDEAQQRVSKGLLGKLFGNGTATTDDAPWYAEIIKDGFMALAPGFNALMQASAQQMTRAQTFVAQQNGAPPSLPEVPQAAMPVEASPATEPQSPAPPSPYEVMFRVVLNQRKLPAPLNQPHRAANAIWATHDQYNLLTPNGGTFNPFDEMLDAFVSVEASECLALAKAFAPDEAAVIDQPDTAEWLKAVQDEIRKEWMQDDASIQDSAPQQA